MLHLLYVTMLIIVHIILSFSDTSIVLLLQCSKSIIAMSHKNYVKLCGKCYSTSLKVAKHKDNEQKQNACTTPASLLRSRRLYNALPNHCIIVKLWLRNHRAIDTDLHDSIGSRTNRIRWDWISTCTPYRNTSSAPVAL